MRVITGQAGGRKLKAPKGMDTRPTSDRIKESLFNIIGQRIIDSTFLDLYAGTGAIGIEAISRGVLKAVFVENNPRAIKIIRDNLNSTGLADMAEVISREVDIAIQTLSKCPRKFDIIFLDPPYLRDLVQKSLVTLDKNKILATEGLVIAESSKLDTLPEKAGSLEMLRQEKYGDTILSFYQQS